MPLMYAQKLWAVWAVLPGNGTPMTYRWPGISGREDSRRLLNLAIVLSIRARRVSAIAGTPSSRLDSDTDGSCPVRLDSGEASPCSRWGGIRSDSQGLTFLCQSGEREVTGNDRIALVLEAQGAMIWRGEDEGDRTIRMTGWQDRGCCLGPMQHNVYLCAVRCCGASRDRYRLPHVCRCDKMNKCNMVRNLFWSVCFYS